MSRLEATIKAIFSISEICIEESKSHISSENAIKAIRELLGQTQSYTELKKLADELQYYRSLDKQGRLIEVRLGHWRYKMDEDEIEYLECPLCGGIFYDGDNDTFDVPYNHCPNCGAKLAELNGENI